MANQNGRLILIVDDFEPNRELYKYVLSEKGFRVETACDGEEGLNKAFELGPDLILMDLSLPRMSGGDAARKLKSDEKTKHIPIVILTAYESGGLAAALGCEKALTKPCLPDALLSEISQLLHAP